MHFRELPNLHKIGEHALSILPLVHGGSPYEVVPEQVGFGGGSRR
jgi:hypothetical protein